MNDDTELTPTEQLLLMAAAVVGSEHDDDDGWVKSFRVIVQILRWLGLSPEQIRDGWRGDDDRSEHGTTYATLIGMTHQKCRDGGFRPGMRPGPALFEGLGNWGVPGNPDYPACDPHYNSCRLSTEGKRLALKLLNDYPEYDQRFALAADFSDRLAEAVLHKRTPLCVGLDPRWESLPKAIRDRHPDPAEALERFCLRVLDLVHEFVPVVKPQMAFFEACGPNGLFVLQRILRAARERNLVTILDSKRGDIASTATAYAEACFHIWKADSMTVNPYLGRDAVQPFIDEARKMDGGLFVLVRTSNPGSGLFQNLVCNGKPLYEQVASSVGEWSAENLGACGLGDVGAVIGATHPRELIRLRELLPHVWFLVPGFGAQGGTAEDVLPALRPDGLGAVVNSSRGVTFPFHPDDPNWEATIVEATRRSVAALSVGR